jgi:hypothetical protein
MGEIRYAELASTRFVNGTSLLSESYTARLPPTAVVYSESRRVFFSQKASYMKIERYADLYGARQAPSFPALTHGHTRLPVCR